MSSLEFSPLSLGNNAEGSRLGFPGPGSEVQGSIGMDDLITPLTLSDQAEPPIFPSSFLAKPQANGAGGAITASPISIPNRKGERHNNSDENGGASISPLKPGALPPIATDIKRKGSQDPENASFSLSPTQVDSATRRRKAWQQRHTFSPSNGEGVRFVTASAILSRSGAVFPLSTPDPDLESDSDSQGEEGISAFFGRRQSSNSPSRRRATSSPWSAAGGAEEKGSDSEDDETDNKSLRRMSRTSLSSSHSQDQQQQRSQRRVSSSGSNRSRGGTRPSNGSALEALSTLLLGTEASGKISSLSSLRKESSAFGGADAALGGSLSSAVSSAARSLFTNAASVQGGRDGAGYDHRPPLIASRVSEKWSQQLQWLQDQTTRGLSIRLPGMTRGPTKAGPDPHAATSANGSTIAERRAQKWFTEGLRASLRALSDTQRRFVEEVDDNENDGSGQEGNEKKRFVRVGTKRNLPSFQMSVAKPKADVAKASFVSQKRHPSGSSLDGELEADPFSLETPVSPPPHHLRRAQSEILTLRAAAPAFSPTNTAAKVYGKGSAPMARGGEPLPDAPPSPVGMPGAWLGGHAWRARPGDGFEEGALLLPPPLLDDAKGDTRAFEGK